MDGVYVQLNMSHPKGPRRKLHATPTRTTHAVARKMAVVKVVYRSLRESLVGDVINSRIADNSPRHGEPF